MLRPNLPYGRPSYPFILCRLGKSPYFITIALTFPISLQGHVVCRGGVEHAITILRPAPRTQSKRVVRRRHPFLRENPLPCHLIPTSRWMQYNTAKRRVRLLLQASVNTFGSLAFDGYANGFLTITIPQDWTVDVNFVNEQNILKNSAMISQLKQGGPFTPAVPGASSPRPTQDVTRGIVQHFQFVASRSGRYAVVSSIPDGQSSSGIWDNVVVKNVTQSTIRVT